MATLDTLPFDVLFEILSAAQTVQDLYSLAFSSRSLYSVFQQHQLSITCSVLKTELGPANYRELVAILYIPDAELVPETNTNYKSEAHCPLDYDSDADSDADSALLYESDLESDLEGGFGRDSGYEPDFRHDHDGTQRHAIAVLQPHLDLYFSNQPFNDPSNATHIAQILRMYKAVSRLTDLYFSRLTELLLPSSGPPNSRAATLVSPALSSTENTRIQRALLRYEFYTRLFQYDKGKKRTRIPAKNQFRIYIGRMNRWEVEDIASIHQFLIALTTDYLVGFEEQLVETLLTRPGVWRPPPPPPTPPMHHSNKKRGWSSDLMGCVSYLPPHKCLRLTKTGTREYETMVTVDEEDLVGFDPRARRWRKKLMVLYTEHLVNTAGLDFFSTLVHASSVPDGGKEQRQIFRSAQLERLLLDDDHENRARDCYHDDGARACFQQVLKFADRTRCDKRYYDYHHDIPQTVSEGNAGQPNDALDPLMGSMRHLRKTFRWEDRQRLDERLDDVRVPISQWRWLVREFPWCLRDKSDT